MRYGGRMKLTYGLGLALGACVWLSATGCDDDRNLGDLGAGGFPDDAEGGSSGAGSKGAGSPGVGGGDAVAGQSAGGHGGAGGASANECPSDFFAADGTECSNEGQLCSDGANDPCEFGNSLRCLDGVWERQEAFPAPCGQGGAGGAGSADAGGAGGAP
jgi:hypothetical protein